MKNSIAKGERWNALPPRSKTRQEHLLSPPLFNIMLEDPASAVRKKDVYIPHDSTYTKFWKKGKPIHSDRKQVSDCQ